MHDDWGERRDKGVCVVALVLLGGGGEEGGVVLEEIVETFREACAVDVVLFRLIGGSDRIDLREEDVVHRKQTWLRQFIFAEECDIQLQLHPYRCLVQIRPQIRGCDANNAHVLNPITRYWSFIEDIRCTSSLPRVAKPAIRAFLVGGAGASYVVVGDRRFDELV